jgi:sugar phosphate isomerase/epimerase
MNKLSAFADEVSQDLDEEIEILQKNGVDNIELRGVWSKKVLTLSTEEVKQIKQKVSEAGMGFSAIGSPLGKFPLDGKLEDQLEDTKKAIEFATILEAPYIRIFSFHIPKGDDPAIHRSQVMDWLSAMIQEAEKSNVILAHENEKGIYGDTAKRCLDLYQNLSGPSFTGIFDFANFVQCEQRPYDDCWKILSEYITYFHIKDARWTDGHVVPAGEGDGDMEKILKEAYAQGYDNYLTLEPHLSVAEVNYGRTSVELFHTAVTSLKSILQRVQ